MTVTYHHDIVQGSNEWLELRRGKLTASEMKLLVTPTLKVASNDKERAHLWELLAQRITGRIDEKYQGDHMLRGHAEEAEARYAYETNYRPVEVCGFVTNDSWGFTLGYSPDGLVGAKGLIEVKSRLAKYQVETICGWQVPDEHLIQVQAALLITGREWLDFLSYSNGMHMATIPVEPDPLVHEAILNAAHAFEAKMAAKIAEYQARLAEKAERLIPTIYNPPLGDIHL
jgi:predicted phage-related endonuclease